MENFNRLTPAEAERLALLLEELGEAQQAIGKILRHGYDGKNPNSPSSETNRWQLQVELGDVQAAIKLMAQENDISENEIGDHAKDKLLRIGRYLHHNKYIF
jgi:NTP pyrophosphatase (non-canonical NTP hydrolase)